MADTPDTAQRLAEIRAAVTKDPKLGRSSLWQQAVVPLLLDHIDTLTARAETAEAERDELRAALQGIADHGCEDVPNARPDCRSLTSDGSKMCAPCFAALTLEATQVFRESIDGELEAVELPATLNPGTYWVGHRGTRKSPSPVEGGQ